MKKVRLTYAEIARKVGMSVSHVSRVMRGEKEPSLTCLCKIAFVVGMSAGEFVKMLERRKRR